MERKRGVILVYCILLVLLPLQASAICWEPDVTEDKEGSMGWMCYDWKKVFKVPDGKLALFESVQGWNWHSGRHSKWTGLGIRLLRDGKVIGESVITAKVRNAVVYSNKLSGIGDEIHACSFGDLGKGEIGAWKAIYNPNDRQTGAQYGSKPLYCASDGTWTEDLDSKDKESCEAAGFKWTGSKCCSEADDLNEYYNDPASNAIGACWDKGHIATGEFSVPDRVISYRGKFTGCQLADSTFLTLKDSHTNALLVENSVAQCGAVLNNARAGGMPHAVCRGGKWEFTEELLGTMNKSIAWVGLVDPTKISITGCCAFDQCWNGTRCQPVGGSYRIGDAGFMCKL